MHSLHAKCTCIEMKKMYTYTFYKRRRPLKHKYHPECHFATNIPGTGQTKNCVFTYHCLCVDSYPINHTSYRFFSFKSFYYLFLLYIFYVFLLHTPYYRMIFFLIYGNLISKTHTRPLPLTLACS